MDPEDRTDGVHGLIRPNLRKMPGYQPVEPIDVVAKRLGIREDEIAKLDANENLYGPSPSVLEALSRFRMYHIYPDPAQTAVREAVAQYVGASPEQVVLGSGSDEMLDLVARIFVSPGDIVVDAPPTFGVYGFLADIYDARRVDVPRREDFSLDLPALEQALADGGKLLYLASPNNPTGNHLSREDLERLLRYPAVVVVDEAYAEFAGESAVGMVDGRDNLIVVRTFSKWAGLAGLRAGYAVVPEALVDIIWRVKIPYNLSVASEQAILATLHDVDGLKVNVRRIVDERERLYEKLVALDWLRPYPSRGNFILCEVKGRSAGDLHDRLRDQGILVRYYDSTGLRNCVRISVGKPEHTERLMHALSEIGDGVGK